MELKTVVIFAVGILILATPIFAEPIDISDKAVEKFLTFPFQYDYTSLTDDASLRKLIETVDYQLALIEYRSLTERMAGPNDSTMHQRFAEALQGRYSGLLRDGYLFKKLNQWRDTTRDPINRQSIDLLNYRHQRFLTDPNLIERVQSLAGRIGDRLYKFHFKIDDKFYSATETGQIIESGTDHDLARSLYRLQHDSAAVLSNDAARLYILYNQLGEQWGFPSSFDFSVSRLSFSREQWYTIAENLKKVTDDEYNRCLNTLTEKSGRDKLALFEIELLLREGATLSDQYFPVEKSETAVRKIFSEAGLDSLYEGLDIQTVITKSWPTVAIKMCPPYENRLIKSSQDTFAYYRRLVAEAARSLPWIYADTLIPYILRDYPTGTEEMLTTLFENRAMDKSFLAEQFDLPPEELDRFDTYNRWLSLFRLRQILMNFFFDHDLSGGQASDPATLYHSLEKSLLGVDDESYYWIETLITGSLEKYPTWLAYNYSRIKLEEMLSGPSGKMTADGTARLIIDQFCRPGRSQTLQEFITANNTDPLSVDDLKRQLGLK